jgi:hypothetical protein
MNRLQRAALLTEFIDRLNQQGSWSGETHLQKGTYFLQHLLGVPTGFDFIFYKFGPFSFDLRDELTAMEADGLVEMRVRHPSYGPSLIPSQGSRSLRECYPVTLRRYDEPLSFICRMLGQKGVAELERLATALFVTLELGEATAARARAARLNELKPHVSASDALAAVLKLDEISASAKALDLDRVHG